MLDFNTKKEILRNLRSKRNKNKLLWLPCVIAELFVKLWYAVVCSIDMALSDKNGNFLGLKKRKSEKIKSRKKDDIVHVKKPFLSRVLSAVLAFAFTFMMVPELGLFNFVASAATNYIGKNELVIGQCVDDTNSYWFKADEYDAASNATVSSISVAFANGCAQLTWSAPSGFESNKSCTYFIGYTTNKSADVTVSDNYSGTTITVENLADDTFYTFYVIPRISLDTYEQAYTEDLDGNKVPVVENGVDQYYKKGTKRVEGEKSEASQGQPNGKITPPVSLSTIDFDESRGEVILTWPHTSIVNLTGLKPYGYVVYRCIMDYSSSDENYELIDYFSADSHMLADGETIEYRDGSIQYGRVYKYYIKAYENLFGGTQYIDNEPGIVTSGDHTVTTGKLTVSIPPAKALNMQVISNGKDALEVSWDEPRNSNVDGYRLFRSEMQYTDTYIDSIKTTNSNGESVRKYWDEESQSYDYYKFIMDMVEAGNAKQLSPSGNEYEDKYSTRNQLENDKIYYYYLIPYVDADRTGIKKLYGPMSSASGSIDATLAAPQWTSVSTEDGTVTLKWKAVTGADGYRIYITKIKNYTGSSKGLGDMGYIDVGNATSYTIDGLLNGDQYSYRLKAYSNVATNNTEDPTKLFSDYSASRLVTIGTELGVPQDLKVTTKDGQNTITWSQVKGAEGYYLYYRCNGGSWKSFDVTKESFNHTGLNNGDIYDYYVVAYKVIDKSYDENKGGKEQIVESEPSVTVSIKVGDMLDAPKDFAVETEDGVAHLSWTKVNGAEGYIIEATRSGYPPKEFDVSKEKYDHTGLENGDVWTYRVRAYKTVNGERDYSDYTRYITVTIGISLNAPVDLMATAGNRQIDLSWTAVKGAEGYIVYLYDEDSMEYEPLTVTSKTSYSHVGLKNGKAYTYMVAAFKTTNGERHIGEYSMPITAIPTTGSITDIDHTLNIKGTTPYGISHSEYISAKTNHDAFSESVDVYITTNQESTKAVKDVLKNYANGLSSFIIYPFDISVYKENTLIKVDPEDGYTVTMTIPIPDKLIAYRDYLTVVHINENVVENIEETEWYEIQDQRLEVLPCAILDIDNVWCVQFVCSSFSPYAFVIYKDHINDVSSGGGVMDGSFAGTFNSGMLLLTTLPDIMPNNKKLTVVESKKRYRIKKITKK